MNTALIFGGLLAACGVVVMLVMESKLIGLVVSGLGALFLVLSFYSDFSASKNASGAEFKAVAAEFNADFAAHQAEQKGEDPAKSKTVDALTERAVKLRHEADAADVTRKAVEAKGEETRKPLLDAVTRQVNQTAQKSMESNKGSMGE